jgi:hypothetical protein
MRSHRVFKRWVFGGLMAVLLFMQLATAAYACASALHPEPEAAAMPGCDGIMARDMQAEQRQLCKAHCQQGEQVVGTPVAGDWTPWPVLLAVIDWRHAALTELAPTRMHVGAPPGAKPPGSPRVHLSLHVLRN